MLLNGLERCVKELSSSSTANLNKNKTNLQEVTMSLKNVYEKTFIKMKDKTCTNMKVLFVFSLKEKNIKYFIPRSEKLERVFRKDTRITSLTFVLMSLFLF